MRRRPPLAALAMLALIAAGCSNGSGDNGATATGTGSSTSKSATTRDKAMRFAACMRENGVREFPDPDASGRLTIDGVVNGSSLDPSDPAWKKAIRACKDLQPAGFTGHKASPQQQNARLKFAQCMRDNGVKDFPDPSPDAPLVDTRRIPSAATDGGMAIINAAMRKCRDAAASAGVEGP